MLIVHHLNNSRSQRVLWLLEELGVKYDIKLYTRDPKTGRAPPSLKNAHPLGRAPIVSDGDKDIAETGAILEYILRKYGNGKLVPAFDSDDYDLYIHFLHYAEGSAMFPHLLALYASFLGDASDPLKPIISHEMKRHLDYIEYHLTGHDYFAGNEFTAADIQMSFPLEAAKKHGRLRGYQACIDFVNNMQARPAYLKALKRGGHYTYGPST